MITIEELYFRRGEDVMVFGPQDVNVQNQTTCTAVTSKSCVSDEEEKDLSSGQSRKSRILNLFLCCFPRRSASNTDINKCKEKSAKKNQKKDKCKDKPDNPKGQNKDKCKDKSVDKKDQKKDICKDKSVDKKEQKKEKCKDKSANNKQQECKDKPDNQGKTQKGEKTAGQSIFRRFFGRKSGNRGSRKTIEDIFTEELRYYNVI